MSQKNNGNLNPLVVAGAVEKKRKKAESKFDPNKLRQLILENKSAKEIMEIMKISHKQILKHHLYKLCTIDNCLYNVQGLYNIQGLYGQNTRKAYVNAKGSIMIKNHMVDFKSLVLEPDETTFDVEVDDVNKKIILTVINHQPIKENNEPEPVANPEPEPIEEIKEF